MRVSILLLGTVALLTLMLLSMGCERKVVNEQGDDQASLSSCFTCHGEEGTLLAAKGEWQNSIHASGNNVDYTNRGEGSDCTKCHDHQGFLDFIATGELDAPYDNVSSIHCFTCHAPHTRGNLTLRVSTPYTLENGDVFNHTSANLCVNCHHSRLSADAITDNQEVYNHWGPHHGPQGDLLEGTNGYEYTGYDYESTGHATAGTNNGCIKCHMGNPQTHIGYKIGGHSFNMIDEETGDNMAGVCETCHSEIGDDFDYEGIQTNVEELLADLQDLLYAAGHVDEEGEPMGTSSSKHVIADEGEAGALWNYVLIEEDRSEGVHNPDYIVGLLESSIAYMEGQVGKRLASNSVGGIKLQPIAAH